MKKDHDNHGHKNHHLVSSDPHRLEYITSYSVAYWLAHQAQLDAGPAFNISDLAANISGALNALNADSHISQIIIDDNASIMLSVSQLTGDATALSKLINYNGSSATLTVSDTAAHIAASFATIATEGQVTRIVVSDNNIVTLTASQANYTVAIGELVNQNNSAASVHVKDTAANLAAHLDSIQADGTPVTQVIVSNSTAMTLTAAQISNDATALGKVVYNNGGTVAFKVSDTGANIGAYLNALQGQTKISTITDSNNAAITLSDAQLTSDASALAKIVNANASAYTLNVADTAANIAGDVSGLNGNSHVASISITDTAANLLSNLDTLAGVTKTMSIALTDGTTPTLAITDTQFHNDSSVLSDITTSYHLTVSGVTISDFSTVLANSHVTSVTVSDSAANVQAALGTLESDVSKITSITLSDGGTPTISISESAYNADGSVLALITNTYDITLTGVSAHDAGSLAGATVGNGTVTQLYVSDTAANVATYLANLDNSDVQKIVVSDGSAIQISIAALDANTAALAKLYASDGSTQGTVTIDDTAANITADLSDLNSDTQVTKIIISDNGLTQVTIAQITSYAHALSELYQSDGVTKASFTVSDTAANIQGAFDALNTATNVTKIVINDNGTVTISASSGGNDGTALGELYLSNGTTHAQVVVSDYASNVSTNLNGLESNLSHISAIYATDGGANNVVVNVSQLTSDAGVLAKLYSGASGSTQQTLTVSDTAANIGGSEFDTLTGDSQVTKIVVADSGTGGVVTIGAASAANDGTALGELYQADGSTHAQVNVSDTAANISSHLDGIETSIGHVAKIIVSDSGSAEVTIDYAQLTGDATALSELKNADGSTLANIAVTTDTNSILEQFSTLGSDSQVNKVILTDDVNGSNEVTVSVAQLSSFAAALAKLYDSNGTTAASIIVSDTSANLATAFDALNGDSQINQITISNGSSVLLSAASAVADTTAEGMLLANGGGAGHVVAADNAANIASNGSALDSNTHVLIVQVIDTAANVATSLNGLNSVTKLASIYIASGTLTITAAQLASDTFALGKILDSFNIAVTNVTVANVGNIAGEVQSANANATLTSIAVSDIGANYTDSALQSLGANSEVTSLAVTSGALSLSASQVEGSAEQAGLNKITGSYTLDVSGAVADVSAVETAFNGLSNHASGTLSIAVSDVGANYTDSALQSLGSDSHVASLSVTSEAISLTASQMEGTAEDAGLNKITGSYTLDVSGAVADLSGVESAFSGLTNHGNATLSITVSDTAANISTGLDTLGADAYVHKIIVSDSGSNEVQVSVAQLPSDAAALAELYNSDGATPAHVKVSDGVSNIQAALDVLNAATQVDHIHVSDSTSMEVTAATAVADVRAESITTFSNGDLGGFVVMDNAANVAANMSGLNDDSYVGELFITDSAANVAAHLDALNGYTGIGTYYIDIIDSGTLTVTEHQLNTDTTVFNAINNGSNGYDVVVTNVLAADAAGIASTVSGYGGTLTSISVTDTAANIASALNTLNGLAHLTHVIVSDSGSNEVQVSVAQVTSDATVLSELYNSDGTTHASVTVRDTAANISAAVDSLSTDGQVNKVTISDGGTITVDYTHFVNGLTALGEISNASWVLHVTGVSVSGVNTVVNDYNALPNAHPTITMGISDTAANISADLDNLNTGTFTTITITDSNPLSVSAFVFENGLDALQKINGTFTVDVTGAVSDVSTVETFYAGLSNKASITLSIAVSDTAGNVAGDASGLNSDAHVTSVSVTDTAANVVNNSSALGTVTALSSVTVNDTGSNVEQYLSGLNGVSHLHVFLTDGAIVLNDAGGDFNYSNVLHAITNSSYSITGTNVAAAHAAGIDTEIAGLSGTVTFSMYIVDSSANIAANLDTLNGLAHIANIVSNDGATMSITEMQLVRDTTALGIMNHNGGSTEIAVTQVTAASAGSIAGDLSAIGNPTLHLQSISVTDTAANIGQNFDALDGNTYVNKIIVSDSGTGGVVTIDAAQAGADSTALGELYQADGTTHANADVSDTAANIAAAIGSLNGAAHLAKIIVSDSASHAVTLSAASALADTTAESMLYQANGTDHALVTVADTASNIGAAFGDLVNSPYVNQVDVTNNADVQITAQQAITYSGMFGEFYKADGTTQAVFDVLDSAANITTNLDGLESIWPSLNHIIVNVEQGGEVTVSVFQLLIGDNGALSKLVNSDGSTAHVAVSDTAADIQGELDALNGNTQVDHIIISDNAQLTLGAQSAATDSHALGELQNADNSQVSLVISDTAANIAIYLDQLNGVTTISQVQISDSNPLLLGAAQIASDATILGKLAPGSSIDVSDTAANLSQYLDALQANNDIVSIIDGNNAALSVSVAQLTTDASVLSTITNTDGTTPATIDVLDTAANIEAHISDLNANTTPAAIIISDNAALAMTIAQFTGDGSLLSRLQNANGQPYQLNISDNGANISSALDSLAAAADAGNSHIASITDTNEAAITLNVAQITSDAAALSKLVNGDGSAYTLSVNDTAANLSAGLNALESNSHVAQLVVTDSGSNEVQVSVAQVTSDATVLGELYNSDGTTHASVSVYDTAANVQGGIATLESDTQVNKIIVSDSASNEVKVSVAGLTTYATALAELYDANGTTHANVTVSDTAADISAAFDSLNGNSQVNKIIVGGNGPGQQQEVAISVYQLGHDTTALAELYNSDGVTLANVAIDDTASNISAALGTLNGSSRVNKIVVSDGPANQVTASVAQLTSDATALGELYNANGSTANVTVYDTVANVQADLAGLESDTQVNKIELSNVPHQVSEITVNVAGLTTYARVLSELYNATGTNLASFAVSDTAANIASAFDTLNGDTQINKIVVSDSGSNEVTISVAQLADTTALGELYNADGLTLASVAVRDTAANISSAIDTLRGTAQINKVIVSDSGSGNEVSVNVAQLTSEAQVLSELYNADGTTHASVVVSDAARFIGGSEFDTLNSNTQVNKIIVGDSGSGNEVTISVAQLGDTRAIGELYNSDGSTLANLTISDTAANISGAAFDTLNNDARVNSIVISDAGTVIISALQAHNDTNALDELTYPRNANNVVLVEVSDTAANIQAQLDNLNGNAHVGSIVVTDTPDFQLSAAQVGNDTRALGLIASDNSGVTIEVTDTAANISTYLDALNSNPDVTSITISNNGAIVVSANQLLSADTTAISELQNANATTVMLTVEDTAANLSAHLSDLASYSSSNAAIGSVIISDSQAISVAVGNLAADAAIIGDLSNANHTPYMLDITGNASQISTYLNTLETYAQGSHVQSITITDSAAVVVTVAQITSDASAIALLSNAVGGGYSLAVQDSTPNVAAALDALNANTHVTSIDLTSNGGPTGLLLTITESQLVNDTRALGEITNVTWNIAITNVLAADAASIASEVTSANANATLASISVSDTAANVVANLGALNGVAHLTAITLTDDGTPTLTITETQLTGDTAALDLIANAAYNLAVTNVAAADAASIASDVAALTSNATLASISVLDTAANIQSALNALQGVAGGSVPLTIVISDSASNEVNVTVAQLTSDAAALANLYDANGTTHANVAVADDAGNITTALDALNGDTQVDKIYVTNAPQSRVAVTVAQLTSDAHALGELYVYGTTTHAAVRVVDTAANISAALGALNSDSQVTKIEVSDSGSNEVTVSVAQLTSDAHLLSELYDSDGATHANVTVFDTAADISAALSSLNTNTQVNRIVISDNAPLNLVAQQAATDSTALSELQNQNGQPVSLTITDTAANIATYLDALNGISTISAITISDNNPLTLTASQVANDATALGKVADANGQPIVINVNDTAAHISQYLDGLEANNYIGTITVSDNQSVQVSVAQLSTDSDAIAALVNQNGSAVQVTVYDTAANIQANLGTLNEDVLLGPVTSIVVSNSAQMTFNASQVDNNAAALLALRNANGNPVSEKVSDTAANIANSLDILQEATVVIGSIVVSNNVALTVAAYQVAQDATALAEVHNKNGGAVTFKVLDSAVNISENFNSLAGNSQISTITVSDNGSVTLSVVQLTSDAAALGKLVNQNGNPYTLTVSDTAANLSGAEFDALNGNTHVTSIVISDSNPITLSVSELTNDTRALGELSNANNQPYGINVVDTGANIQAAFDSLNGHSHIHQIIVSDSGSGGTVTLTALQAATDATALGEIYQAGGTSKFLVNVTDTGANISTNLNALETLAADFATITVSDSSPLSVNAGQVISDATVLAKMVNGAGHHYLLAVSDTAANISADLVALGQNGHVTTVTVTDNGVVTATYANYSQYNTIFYDIQGTHYIDITNVTGQAYTSFTETINGNHQLLLADYYDANGNQVEQLQYQYNQDGTEVIHGQIVGKPYATFTWTYNAQHQLSDAAYYNTNGSLYENVAYTYNQDGTHSTVITGLAGTTEITQLFAANGSQENQFNYYTNNTVTAYFYENGQTFTSNGETTGIKITAGTSGDTFNFNGQFGTIAISNYVPGSETINWDHNDFANIAAVEAHARQDGAGDTIITLDAHDTITLTGVTLAQFEAHTADWHFI